jgi:tetratricopeptide (TPR) repeat protein
MQSVLESWQQAQRHEAAGAWRQARPLYESILATEPGHVPARLRMSRLEQVADRYAPGRAHVLQAAAAVRERGGSRHIGYVTARLLDFAEEDEAAALVLAADWDDPDFIRQSPALAQHLWLARRYEEALRLLDAMSRHAPAHPLLAFTRGNVLRYLGDIDGAGRQYEASVALDPGLADAHWALATHSRAQPPLARVPRLRAALERAGDATARAQLLYALFHEYDGAGETALAWAALEQGAATVRAGLAHDDVAEARRVEALMRLSVASPEVSAPALDAPRPVFVVGMPRTGTTLLDRILGNHGDVASLGERNDLAAAASQASGRFFVSPLQEGAAALLEGLDAGEAGRIYLQRVARGAPAARHLLDKNPQNLFAIPLILRALPQARIVCLRRDPMDACFSNLKELFQGGAYSYSYAQDELAGHCLRAHRWMEHWQAAAPHAVRLVDYEALVQKPAATAAALLDFLGLPAQAGLDDIVLNRTPVATASSSQVREGVHARAVGAWRRYAGQLQPLRSRLGVQP